ncbi:MAG: O-antigen polymerase [Eubacteriales bacterium]|nr:O-antigen ligase [bacterium]MDY2791623.1 O-antigen polymerase [Eubacteriales bacterium]
MGWMNKKQSICELISLACGALLFFLGIVQGISFKAHLLVSSLFLIGAAGLYFFIVYCVDDGNVLSVKALFTAMWLATIGLANAKLLDYQKEWSVETWLILGGAYVAFHAGALIGGQWSDRLLEPFQKHTRIGKRIHISFDSNRLFGICLGVSLFGIACFCANVLIRGYIPFFVSDDYLAYYSFYTRFYVLVVASTAVSGLCYYTIKTQPISRLKKAILYVCIALEVFIIPMLMVSRGNQMIAMLSLMVSVVALNRKKLLTFILCMAVAFGFYQVGSYARNLSGEFLNYVFQPKKIALEQDKKFPTAESTSPPGNEESTKLVPKTFQLSPSMAFLYGYFTVSHDNLNEAVLHHTQWTHGLRQVYPFTTVIRIPGLREKIDALEFYQVGESLNTANLIADAYYDFGPIGSVVFILFWAMVFGVIERRFLTRRGPFAMLAYGTSMVPVVLCFFESWMSVFALWLLWGTDFLLFLADTVHIERRSAER